MVLEKSHRQNEVGLSVSVSYVIGADEKCPRFGCLLLPDEPAVTAENFDPFGFDETVEGSGSWTNAADGSRFLRLWGLTLGMTL